MLTKLIEDIEAKRYGVAFKLLRQHKIDINLLYDVNPTQLIANIPHFVDQVNSVEHLNLFINSLVDKETGVELEFMRPTTAEDLIKKEHALLMASQFATKERLPT